MASSDHTIFDSATEEWRDIPGYEGLYQASSLGRVRNIRMVHRVGEGYVRSDRILKMPIERRYGYHYLQLSKDNVKVRRRVHVFVAAAFLGKRPEGFRDINHINGNKLDNRPENLEYCTHLENVQHANRLGLRKATKRKPICD